MSNIVKTICLAFMSLIFTSCQDFSEYARYVHPKYDFILEKVDIDGKMFYDIGSWESPLASGFESVSGIGVDGTYLYIRRGRDNYYTSTNMETMTKENKEMRKELPAPVELVSPSVFFESLPKEELRRGRRK